METNYGSSTVSSPSVWKLSWDLQNDVTVRSVNKAYRRGIRRGLGMRDGDSITDRLVSWFVEAVDKMKKEQLLFFKRCMYSSNTIVKCVGCLEYRCKPRSHNLVTCSYKSLKTLV